MDKNYIQAKLDKAHSRLTNLITMRADGEISKDEYETMRKPVDDEISRLKNELYELPEDEKNSKGFDLDRIKQALDKQIDFSKSTISHDVVKQFVYMIVPTSDTSFDWYLKLDGEVKAKTTFTAEGRKIV